MSELFDYVMIDNLFTQEECQQYIEKLNSGRWNSHKWYDNNNSQVQNIKDFSVTYNSDLQRAMTDRVIKCSHDYASKHIGGLTTQYSGIRFNRYQSGESIILHTDHISSLFDGKKKGIPVLSYVGVFNDDYTGGEFMLCNKQIDLKAGDCVVFPSVFLYPHEVKPVITGSRYSWVMWGW